MKNLKFPTLNHKSYIEMIYDFCQRYNLALILKGSLSKGKATKYSDVDIIISGDLNNKNIDDVITIYDTPVMTNFTENPPGIIILVYPDKLSVDLDIRETITTNDLKEGLILLGQDEIIPAGEIIRKKVKSKYIPKRPDWYKMLRLIHKGTLKYLSGNQIMAYDFLKEIKQGLIDIDIKGLDYNNEFINDIKNIFKSICSTYNVESEIKKLFNTLFIDLG